MKVINWILLIQYLYMVGDEVRVWLTQDNKTKGNMPTWLTDKYKVIHIKDHKELGRVSVLVFGDILSVKEPFA